MKTEMVFNRNMNTKPNTPGRHWMLVDDDQDLLLVLSSLAETLTEAKIECFHLPEEALAAFVANPEKYELVITDYEMPGLNGMELCRQMHAVQPGQKLFLLTGRPDMTPSSARGAGFDALLKKPFPLTALKNALAEHFAPAVKGYSGTLSAV